MAYNGWTNRATWNVSLWVNNEEGTYRAMMDARPFTASSAETFCRELFPTGATPDGDSLNQVDWNEIAESFNAD